MPPMWAFEQFEMIADAGRVLGFAGMWVPYRALADKFIRAGNGTETKAEQKRKFYITIAIYR